MNEIVIVNYGLGNVRSISNAFESLGSPTVLTSDAEIIRRARGLVLPGVGAFPAGMSNLQERNLVDPIRQFAKSGKPLFCICLGMQLLFDEGDEFERTSGLGLVPGRVERLPIVDARAKLPHVSWNEILPAADGRWNGTVLETTKPNSDVYFVHSYCALPTNHSHVLASTCYGGISFCSAVQHQNISGFQFHPEKSGPVGLAILKQFIDTCN